ncbi:MAG: hypothetical protein ACRC9K_03545 [Afipia sp.]
MNSLLELKRQLAELRYEFTTIRSEVKYRKLMRALAAGFKYDPDQPREPAGSPNGGRWTSAGGTANERMNDTDSSVDLLTIASKPSAAFCWNQLQIDELFCSAQSPAPRRASCRRQAMER